MKKTLLTAAIALTGLAAYSSAYATANNNDVILGVEDVTGSITKNLLVDLGSYSTFPSFSSINLSSDLTAVFGSGFGSNGNLQYALYSFNRANNTLAASATSTGTGVDAGGNSWSQSTSYGTQSAQFGQLLSEYNGALNSTIANSGTTANGVFVASGDSASWTSLAGAQSSGTFGDGSSGIANNFENTLGTTEDIFSAVQASSSTSSTYTGKQVTLGTDGVLSAVPEPTTYALFGLGALLLVIAVRRRNA